MADTILQNTLQGTLTPPKSPAETLTNIQSNLPTGLQIPETPSGNLTESIKRLEQAQHSPSLLQNFQKVMQLTSTQAYKERQSAELGVEGQAFDPSKVSGGTFANIITRLEENRGGDIGKIYASTMETYRAVQSEITSRLNTLQELEESRRRWEAEQKLEKKRIKILEEQNKEQAKLEKKKFEQSQKEFQMNYQRLAEKASTSYSTDYFQNLTGSFGTITMGKDGYLNPYEFNAWAKDSMANAKTAKDLTAASTLITRGLNLINPADKKATTPQTGTGISWLDGE